MHADIGRVIHRPKPLLYDMTFQWRIFPEVRDEFFEGIGVEDRALHVLRTRIFAAFELKNFEAFLGHGISRGVTRGSRAYNDCIEAFLDHEFAPSARQPVHRKVLAKCFRQGRQKPDGVRDNS